MKKRELEIDKRWKQKVELVTTVKEGEVEVGRPQLHTRTTLDIYEPIIEKKRKKKEKKNNKK